jgi:hypothetical protein
MDKLKPACVSYLKVLADLITEHWFDTVPRSIPSGDNRDAKYMGSATLSINALHGKQYDNIIPQLITLYKKLPAYLANSALSNDDIGSACVECARSFFPDYMFEMMVRNAGGMRSFLNSVLSGAFSQSLVLVKEYSRADVVLILKNDTAFRKYTHGLIYETLVAFRQTIYDRAIQSDTNRTDTPEMLRDDIVRLRSRIAKLESTLKNKVRDYDDLAEKLMTAQRELDASTHDYNISQQLNLIATKLNTRADAPVQDPALADMVGSHMREQSMRIDRLAADVMGVFDHSEKLGTTIRDNIEMKLTSFKSLLSSLASKVTTMSAQIADVGSQVADMRAASQSQYEHSRMMISAAPAYSQSDNALPSLPTIMPADYLPGAARGELTESFLADRDAPAAGYFVDAPPYDVESTADSTGTFLDTTSKGEKKKRTRKAKA